jgi:type VI secretion system protein ImpF
MRSERPVMVSVLDRLIDLQPKLRDDPPVSRMQSIRELKASLQRDLEWLLNTRRIAVDIPDTAQELKKSVYCYGLREFTDVNMSNAGDQLSKYLESSIRTFEPRLADVRVTMRPMESVARVARFVIEAILLIDPVPERVTFDTVLELTRGEYRVRGDS